MRRTIFFALTLALMAGSASVQAQIDPALTEAPQHVRPEFAAPSPAAALYDTHTGPETGFVGNWTVYPYLASGKIIASDMQSGLFVLRLDNAPVATEPGDLVPADGFALDAAYPNPSTGTVTVPFLLAEAGRVRLTVFDVLGREVAVLADEFRGAGSHTVGFDGSNLPGGAYFYRLAVEGAASAQARPFTILR